MHHATDRITHTMAFATTVVEHWLVRDIAQWVLHEGSIGQPIVVTTITTQQQHTHIQTKHPKNKEITKTNH